MCAHLRRRAHSELISAHGYSEADVPPGASGNRAASEQGLDREACYVAGGDSNGLPMRETFVAAAGRVERR